jgi:hypothetical protein
MKVDVLLLALVHQNLGDLDSTWHWKYLRKHLKFILKASATAMGRGHDFRTTLKLC